MRWCCGVRTLPFLHNIAFVVRRAAVGGVRQWELWAEGSPSKEASNRLNTLHLPRSDASIWHFEGGEQWLHMSMLPLWSQVAVPGCDHRKFKLLFVLEEAGDWWRSRSVSSELSAVSARLFPFAQQMARRGHTVQVADVERLPQVRPPLYTPFQTADLRIRGMGQGMTD